MAGYSSSRALAVKILVGTLTLAQKVEKIQLAPRGIICYRESQLSTSSQGQAQNSSPAASTISKH